MQLYANINIKKYVFKNILKILFFLVVNPYRCWFDGNLMDDRQS